MKTLIFSLLLLTLSTAVAQPRSSQSVQLSLVDAGSSLSESGNFQSVKEGITTIEAMSQANSQLNARLDQLLLENKRLESQNQALRSENRQLKDFAPIAAAQNNKQIHHNEKLIAKNDTEILQYAVLIQANQNAIAAK